jgi:hypothetical protein
MKPVGTGYLLTWKGAQTGPFTLEQIRTQLTAGEISRIHRIRVDGGWQLLDEFLTALPESAVERQASAIQQREAQLPQEFHAQLAAERTRFEPPPPPPPLLPSSDEVARRSPLSHLLPKNEPLPILFPGSSSVNEFDERSSGKSHTSGLAIASLVMAVCNFIPYLNFFSWILALVFGHSALGQMKRDPQLGGKALAIAGLAITYFLLVVGLTFAVLVFANYQKLPNFLHL